MPLAAPPVLSPADARAVLAATRGDAELHAGVALLLLAGLRRGEVEQLRVADWHPCPGRLRVAGSKLGSRTIRIAPSAARAVDAYLVGEVTDPEDFLLPRLRAALLFRLVRSEARDAEAELGAHDLRMAAIAATADAGLPSEHAQAYFGISPAVARRALVPMPADYDVAAASALEATFA